MVEVKNTEVFGLERALKAVRNSFTTTRINTTADFKDEEDRDKAFKRGHILGANNDPHQSHDAYLKGIDVYFDIKYEQYWTPEFQRYKFVDIIMSTSKMHKLEKNALKPFEEFKKQFNKYVDDDSIRRCQKLAQEWEKAEGKDAKYEAFMRLVSNLPSGYELEMTCKTNYLQLKTIYTQRTGHKLKEDWGAFLDWCDTLPHFKELTGCSRDTN